MSQTEFEGLGVQMGSPLRKEGRMKRFKIEFVRRHAEH